MMVAVVVMLLVVARGAFDTAASFSPPDQAALAGLSLPQRIVVVAESQIGYRTNPSQTYCNKFSAFWRSGMATCQAGELNEEWCADFAAWSWRVAGVHVPYGYGGDDLNGGAASFYKWGVANGRWHPAGDGYVAQPGDVAVYGLSLTSSDPSASHVAIVTSDLQGQLGPNVVNGDGDQTGFSVVESGTDQAVSYDGHHASMLSGYVSPP
jgi:CHAP domain